MAEPEAVDERHSYYSILNLPRDADDEQIKRAYRSLAQSLHPDKHTDEELQGKAQEAFQRLQEAYDVLRDPQKRAVYDVYGPEGLTAGLQVGTKLDGPEELRRKWEEFKAQRATEAEDAAVGRRAYYMCMLDAVKLVQGDITSVPLPRIIVMQNSVAIPLTPSDTLSLQGSAALRSQAGQGSVIAGYERTLTPRDTLSGSVVLGLQPLVSLTSSRQLGQYTNASLTATYNHTQGMGLQLASTRQVAARTSAQFAWVVGPAAASGMVFSVTHKGTRTIIVAKLEVGALTSISLRLTWVLNKRAELRLLGRAATSGLEGELGLARRLAGSATAYCACTVNRTGILAKVRYTRVNQTYEFPILVGRDYTDWRVLAATTLGPPAAGLLLLRFVVRPWRKWRARVALQQQQQEQAEQLAAQFRKAAAEGALLAPVAARTAATEAGKGGLVVLLAVYGALEGSWREALQQLVTAGLTQPTPLSDKQQQHQRDQQQHLNGNHSAADVASSSSNGAGSSSSNQRWLQDSPWALYLHNHQQQQQQREAATAPGTDTTTTGSSSTPSASSSSSSPPTAATSSSSSQAPLTGSGPQQPWVDVTCAVQYLVRDSSLQLHPGITKVGLMGFADVALQQPRQLYVAYALGRQLFEATVEDLDMLKVPGAGRAVDGQLRQWLEQRLIAVSKEGKA